MEKNACEHYLDAFLSPFKCKFTLNEDNKFSNT